VESLVNEANKLVGTELNAIKGLVHGGLGAVGKAFRGVTRGADGVVSSAAKVVSRKRRNNRK
jgi:hypothetical protein